MTTWTSDELNQIGTAEELEIASLRSDGMLGKATTIWVVRVGNDIYVRPVNGRSGAWFRATQVHHVGHIEAGGLQRDVTFADVDTNDAINDQIDAAYWKKYARYPQYVPPVVTKIARDATLKLIPR